MSTLLAILCIVVWFLILLYQIDHRGFQVLLLWLLIGPIASNLVEKPGTNPFFRPPTTQEIYIAAGSKDKRRDYLHQEEATIRIQQLFEPTRLLLGTFLITFLVNVLLKKRPWISLDRTEIWMVVFSLFLLINVFLLSRRLAFGLRVASDAFIVPFLAYFVARRFITSEARLRKLILTIGYLGAYLIIIGLIERAMHSRLLYRLQGPFGSTNSLYVTMAVVFFIALIDSVRGSCTSEGKQAMPRGLQRFVLYLAPVIIFLNFTRGDWLGFLVGGWAFLFLGRRLLAPSRKIGMIGVALVLLPIIVVSIPALTPDEIIEQRVGRTSTIYGRLGAWKLMLEESAKHPIFGNGLNTTRDFLAATRIKFQGVKSENHAHNSFLAFLFELGISGLFIYLFIVGSIIMTGLKLLLRNPRLEDRWLGVALVAVMAAYLVPAFFGTTLYLTNINHIYVYVLAGAIANAYGPRRLALAVATPGHDRRVHTDMSAIAQ